MYGGTTGHIGNSIVKVEDNSRIHTVGPLIIESLLAKTSVHRGTQGSKRSACGPNKSLKERLSSCR